jgi:hypothetical protein
VVLSTYQTCSLQITILKNNLESYFLKVFILPLNRHLNIIKQIYKQYNNIKKNILSGFEKRKKVFKIKDSNFYTGLFRTKICFCVFVEGVEASLLKKHKRFFYNLLIIFFFRILWKIFN